MYPRFVFDSLPIRLKPISQETLTSLLMHNALANHITFLQALYATLRLSSAYRNPRSNNHLIDHQPLSSGDLATVLACSRKDLLATTFHYLMVWFGREPGMRSMRNFLSGCVARAMRFCLLYLTERQEPCYHFSWQFSSLSGCAIHRCHLWDVCPQCGKEMPLFSAPFTVGQYALCQADLDLAKTVPLSPAEQSRVQTLTDGLTYLQAAPSDLLLLSPSSLSTLTGCVHATCSGNTQRLNQLRRAIAGLSTQVENNRGEFPYALRCVDNGTA